MQSTIKYLIKDRDWRLLTIDEKQEVEKEFPAVANKERVLWSKMEELKTGRTYWVKSLQS